MKQENIGLEQIKQLELDILIAFDKICKKHRLSYQLAYGTLIGAVRHKGFIPWDDDIDLIMPYEDYLKFCDIVNALHTNAIIDNRYRVADYHVASDIPYHQPFMKIYDITTAVQKSSLKPRLGFREGIFIDIFYYSGMPEDKAIVKTMLKQAENANNLLYYATKSIERWELNPLHRAFYPRMANYIHAATKPYYIWLEKYFKALENTIDSKMAKRAFDIKAYLMDGKAFALDDNIWQPTIDGEFEGHTFPIPANYDELLTRFYGDYMTPPPKEEQVPSHNQGYYFI